MREAWWVILPLLVVGLVWAWRRGMRPAPNPIESPEHAADALKFLIKRGIDGAVVDFHCGTTKAQKVSFEKHLLGPNNVELRGYCDVEKSRESKLPSATTALEQQGVSYTIRDADGSKRLEIDIARDVSLGIRFTTIVFQQLFDSTFGHGCIAYFHRVAIFNAPSLTGVDDATD